jgi:hypothetical protein
LAVFISKTNDMLLILQKLAASIFNKKAKFFDKNFGENISKNRNIGPRFRRHLARAAADGGTFCISVWHRPGTKALCSEVVILKKRNPQKLFFEDF